MNCIDSLWAQKELLILDGAMATELERKGLSLNDSLWSAGALAKRPELIRQVHFDYFAAGADCSTSASYQATLPGYEAAGYTRGEAGRLISRSMTLLSEARDEWWRDQGQGSGRPYPLCAAAIGPYGAYLANGSEYTGAYSLTDEQYRAFHLPRMKLLKDAGAELFAVETLPKLEEALACARLLEELDCDFYISFTFRTARQISDGTGIEAICAALGSAYPHLKALGVNCTPPELVGDIIKGFRDGCSVPVCAYPNRGEVYDPVSKTWHGAADPRAFAQWAASWYKLGARLIGGCCRTRPEDIREIYRWYQLSLGSPALPRL